MAKGGYIGIEYSLPIGYTRVEYIQSSGTQYIDTGVFLNEKSSVKMRFEITSTPEQANVFGGRKSATSGNFHLWVNTAGLLTFDYRSYAENRIQRSITTNSLVDISITPTKYVLNGTEYAINGTGAFQTPATVLIFNACGDSHTTSKAHIKLYSCQIYDNGTLVRDFVPCTNPSGVAGLYDVVNGVFYTDAAGGTFTAGSSVPLSVARKVSKVYIGIGHSLPSGYTPIEYIQSSGTQYIDTGFKANQDTKVVMRAAFTNLGAHDTLFGGRTSANSKAYALTYTTAGGNYYRYFYNTEYTSTTLTGDPYKTQVIVADKNKISIGDSSYSWTYGSFQCDYTMYLLAGNEAGIVNRNASAKLYYCQIYDNGTLIRDYVPCTNPSGVAGLYDVVNGVFYTDSAGGTFAAGSSVPLSVARKIVKAYIGDENGIARRWLPSGLSSSDLAVGSSVFMNVGGVRTEFIVVHQGNPSATYYDASCNGTWVLMKDIYEERAWDSRYTNLGYSSSDIHVYLRDQFIGLFDVNIQSVIKQVKIPYRSRSGSEGTSKWLADGLQVKIFLLGGNEVGFTNTITSIGDDGVKLDYFTLNSSDADRIAYLNGVAKGWHLRTPAKNGAGMNYVNANGSCNNASFINKMGVRPALILPSDTLVNKDFNVIA